MAYIEVKHKCDQTPVNCTVIRIAGKWKVYDGVSYFDVSVNYCPFCGAYLRCIKSPQEKRTLWEAATNKKHDLPILTDRY